MIEKQLIQNSEWKLNLNENQKVSATYIGDSKLNHKKECVFFTQINGGAYTINALYEHLKFVGDRTISLTDYEKSKSVVAERFFKPQKNLK